MQSPLPSGPLPSGAPARAPELDGGLPVLLLRTDRNPFHHGTLGAIRSLGRAGVPVHAILEGPGSPAARSRYLHRRHPWGPSPHTAPEALAEHLRHIAGRIGRRTLLLPLDDAGAIFIAEHAPALAECFDFTAPDPSGPRRVADKSLLTEQCARFGIDCPESLVPRSPVEVEAALARLGLPLVVKWPRPWLLPPGHRGTVVARTASEVHRLFALAASLAAPSGPALGNGPSPAHGGPAHRGAPGRGAVTGVETAGPPILQRLVPPEGGDWFFHGHFDGDGACLFGATGRKHLAHPPDAGHTVSGEWVLNPALERLAHKIIDMLGYRGTVDLDFRFDARTGTYHLLDFNPRLGAQFRLFRDGSGLDLVRIAHLAHSGRAVPPARPRYGRTLLVENHLLHHALTRPGGRRAAVRRLREAGELAWFAADDPAPFLSMAGRSAVRGLRRGTAGG
ncbi:ATP-grasp domain-containing protein [Spirillospora sp. CA-255316]